ncbi:hypothetical protein Ga0100231_019895 [Opitutaceae bacterium TAV4]|nr:hypothetical protein Ga0100231_019895 [Opitutaceae bacterium TAV4]RRK00329.1 hypothetical protein Ga0100230_020665 [Opitutaceae bacterium TAV3]
MKRYILIVLCCAALVYIGKIGFGIADLAHYQEVPVAAASFELTMLIGAVIFPLISALRPNKEKKTWHYILWIPCVLYVVAITINYLIKTPVSLASCTIGLLRLAVWLAIATLFIREVPKKTAA